MLPPLPIDDVLPALVDALRAHANVVLQAPTGAGKTTRVPPALLDAKLAHTGQILLVEPRRLAARAAAGRMAFERGQQLGGDVGFHVRFDRVAGRGTRILAVTQGILLRRLLDDPYLSDVDAVIFDEFHERSLQSDLALGMTRLVQQTVRPELHLVIMSATLETEAAAAYLGNCPIVRSEGRLFDVEIRYEAKAHRQTFSAAAAEAAVNLLDGTPGDLLVFLPGWSEIRHTANLLEAVVAERDLVLHTLHGDLAPEEQDAALVRGSRRKIVLATNVAETSVTVDGVTGVVDTGVARQMNFDPSLGLDRLQLTPIAQMSAEQRAGRAGRQQSGVCIRLWSEASHRLRPRATEPEIRRVDLAAAVLQLLSLGETDLEKFPWFEKPRAESVAQALLLLDRLGATQDGNVTDLGRLLARLPIHPRLGRMLVEGWRLGQVQRAALAAALLSERDPFPVRPDAPAPSLDLFQRLDALEAFDQRHVAAPGLHRGMAKTVLRVRDQVLRELRGEARHASWLKEVTRPAEEDTLPRALLAGFPERVVKRRPHDPRRGVMVGGRGVLWSARAGAGDAELYLALDVEDRPKEAQVRLSMPIPRDALSSQHLSDAIEVYFDDENERVAARRRLRYFDLMLEESPAALTDAAEATRVLREAAQSRLDRVLPSSDSPAGVSLTRLRCLREWLPDANLPAIDDEKLRELLTWLCNERRSFKALREGPWIDALQSVLSHQQTQLIEREAPARLEVPSGNRITLHYELGKPPVLAVRIQELFGLKETPRIAAGRIRVLLHLLAPSQRPQQVTEDLASFWANVYPRIRKELRAKYPKHAWPEDPLTAPPQSRPQRRS